MCLSCNYQSYTGYIETLKQYCSLRITWKSFHYPAWLWSNCQGPQMKVKLMQAKCQAGLSRKQLTFRDMLPTTDVDDTNASSCNITRIFLVTPRKTTKDQRPDRILGSSIQCSGWCPIQNQGSENQVHPATHLDKKAERSKAMLYLGDLEYSVTDKQLYDALHKYFKRIHIEEIVVQTHSEYKLTFLWLCFCYVDMNENKTTTVCLLENMFYLILKVKPDLQYQRYLISKFFFEVYQLQHWGFISYWPRGAETNMRYYIR
jgi:hypothetical protein